MYQSFYGGTLKLQAITNIVSIVSLSQGILPTTVVLVKIPEDWCGNRSAISSFWHTFTKTLSLVIAKVKVQFRGS